MALLLAAVLAQGAGACTAFEIGEDAPGLDGSHDSGGDAGEVGDTGLEGDGGDAGDAGAQDGQSATDAEVGDGPYTEGPCRVVGRGPLSFVNQPNGAFQLALHPGMSSVALDSLGAVAFLDEALGLYGFALQVPAVASINTTTATASREYFEQFIDPLFSRSLPGVIGIAERVDETLRQNFSRVNRRATRTIRDITMVYEARPSTLRDALLSAMTGAPLTALTGIQPREPEPETRTLRFAAYVEADALALAYNIVVVVSTLERGEALEPYLQDLTNGTHLGTVGDPVVLACEELVARALRVDFLWIIDNSASMQQEQEALAEAAGDFFAALEASQIDFRLGVVSTDGEALRGGDFTQDLETFKQRVRVGMNGNGREQGLEYSLRAIEYSTTTTRSYERLRDDAVPVVIFYSDEDSTNYRPLADYIRFFRDRQVLPFAVVGPRPRGCTAVGRGAARAGTRYIEVVEAVGGITASICAEDLTQPIQEILVTAAGFASQTQIRGRPISGSIEVALRTSTVTRSRENGFDFEAASNALVFFGSGNIAEGTPFRVTYLEYLPFQP